MKQDTGFNSLSSLLVQPTPSQKLPAYQWQELALKIIGDLAIPRSKRNSVFRVCKLQPREKIERALNDTKELCKDGESWKYFFKVLASDGLRPTDWKPDYSKSKRATK